MAVAWFTYAWQIVAVILSYLPFGMVSTASGEIGACLLLVLPHPTFGFRKLRCRKSARRCGAKQVWKWKCTKHLKFGTLLEVKMSKRCTPFWREAPVQVKSCKTCRSRTTFGSSNVEKVHAVVARSTFWVKMLKWPDVRTTFGSCDLEKVHAVVGRSTFGSKTR